MERPGELHEVVGHERLESNVQTILQRIERELDAVDIRIGEKMHVLDVDNDGLVRPSFRVQRFPAEDIMGSRLAWGHHLRRVDDRFRVSWVSA